jgi:hypothetical protein
MTRPKTKVEEPARGAFRPPIPRLGTARRLLSSVGTRHRSPLDVGDHAADNERAGRRRNASSPERETAPETRRVPASFPSTQPERVRARGTIAVARTSPTTNQRSAGALFEAVRTPRTALVIEAR